MHKPIEWALLIGGLVLLSKSGARSASVVNGPGGASPIGDYREQLEVNPVQRAQNLPIAAARLDPVSGLPIEPDYALGYGYWQPLSGAAVGPLTSERITIGNCAAGPC